MFPFGCVVRISWAFLYLFALWLFAASAVKLMIFSWFAGAFSICMCFLKLQRVELSWPPYTLLSKSIFSLTWFAHNYTYSMKPHLRMFKGHLLCKIHFYMVLGHKCVLAMCEHNHPTQIHPLLIFESPLNQVSLTRLAVLTLTAVWRHISEGGVTGFDWQPCVAIVFTLSGYAVLYFLRALAAVTSTLSSKQSRALCLDVRLNMSLHFNYNLHKLM